MRDGRHLMQNDYRKGVAVYAAKDGLARLAKREEPLVPEHPNYRYGDTVTV